MARVALEPLGARAAGSGALGAETAANSETRRDFFSNPKAALARPGLVNAYCPLVVISLSPERLPVSTAHAAQKVTELTKGGDLRYLRFLL